MKDSEGRLTKTNSASAANRPSPVLVVGLGNPILGDDGVGWAVAKEVSRRLGTQSKVEVDCAALGGLSLMERLIDYEYVILIDSLETGQNPVGSVTSFPLNALSNPTAGHTSSTHDTTLMTALRTAESMGATIPQQINVVAIEAHNLYDFSEEFTPPIEAAIPEAVEIVLGLLHKVLLHEEGHF